MKRLPDDTYYPRYDDQSVYGEIEKRLFYPEKRHLGSAMSSFYRGGVLPLRNRREARDNLVAALNQFYDLNDEENHEMNNNMDDEQTQLENQEIVEDTSSLNDETDTDSETDQLDDGENSTENTMDEDKRHIGSALNYFRGQNTVTNQDKRHLGSALRYFNREPNADKRHIGSAMRFFKKYPTDKRRLGSALRQGFGRNLYQNKGRGKNTVI